MLRGRSARPAARRCGGGFGARAQASPRGGALAKAAKKLAAGLLLAPSRASAPPPKEEEVEENGLRVRSVFISDVHLVRRARPGAAAAACSHADVLPRVGGLPRDAFERLPAPLRSLSLPLARPFASPPALQHAGTPGACAAARRRGRGRPAGPAAAARERLTDRPLAPRAPPAARRKNCSRSSASCRPTTSSWRAAPPLSPRGRRDSKPSVATLSLSLPPRRLLTRLARRGSPAGGRHHRRLGAVQRPRVVAAEPLGRGPGAAGSPSPGRHFSPPSLPALTHSTTSLSLSPLPLSVRRSC